MRKRYFVLAAVVLATLLLGAAWWFLRSGNAKAELERVLSDALARDVTIGALELDPRGHVSLVDVVIANPPGFEGAPILRAARLDIDVALDTLLDRELVGVVQASGVELHVVKRDATTNLHGMLPERGGGGGGKPTHVHLDLVIEGARVVVDDEDRGEQLVLEGVDLRLLASNAGDERRAEAQVTIASVSLHGVVLREVGMRVHGDRERIALDELVGAIGEHGTLRGSGSLFLGETQGWRFELVAEAIDLAGDVAPVVTTLYPPLASSIAGSAATGSVGGTFALSGTGLHWEQIRPTLAGQGRITLVDVVVPRDSLLPAIAALAGGEGQGLSLARVDVELALEDGWVTLERVTSDAKSVELPITGRVSLLGELDLKVELMPLVQAFGGGAYASAARYTTSIPVRIRGTTRKPELAPPKAEDLARGLLGAGLRRALSPGQ